MMNWECFLSDLTSTEAPAFDRKFPKQAGPGIFLICQTFAGRRNSEDEFKTCSEWTLEEFRKYIGLDDLRRLSIVTTNVILHYSVKSITDKKLEMFQIGSNKPDLEEVQESESNVRILINFVLQKLCRDLKFGVKTEEEIKPAGFPSCKFDFLFYNHRKEPIGCLKTKSSSTMTSDAFVQSVLELFVLQKFASEENVDVKKVPLFNILTDGRRFVLLQVKADKILVEQNEQNHLKIHTDGVMESLYRLIQMSVDASVE